ncbi:DUF3717 domain-containing protein [Pandoraea sp.]|uniref:DUF3717 domain-containing protein n=1 Tax=Pandoraea sp. TaxID=1883445 RepID=UPI001217759B|nr:DUF3717 domain-containing protein [Pandoraea sp.]MBU6492988.1 DUF3717 domain-containing protein [Burkholderiales bacterium]MDE2289186.1 DUF3717 domain-containing protein [Burkholderiales bacterium]MDE2608451.1 DUF3717 domain-containing protein [Burkholderiales bacterium]TAL53949.1 MAG: DUF3717 domain-containing protein [Pandoraea sp.]TAM20378.1 MAG: DUF3717 domain-containing protein [Pandoraea sp.]
MADITLTELEAAINYWRSVSPAAGEEMKLCSEASALSRPYALMIVGHASSVPLAALDDAARSAWEAYQRRRG